MADRPPVERLLQCYTCNVNAHADGARPAIDWAKVAEGVGAERRPARTKLRNEISAGAVTASAGEIGAFDRERTDIPWLDRGSRRAVSPVRSGTGGAISRRTPRRRRAAVPPLSGVRLRSVAGGLDANGRDFPRSTPLKPGVNSQYEDLTLPGRSRPDLSDGDQRAL